MCLSKTAHLYSLEDSLCLLSVKGSSKLRMNCFALSAAVEICPDT